MAHGPTLTALQGALAFALAPLAWLWGRTEVSDALFSGLLSGGLLLAWRTYAARRGAWWPCWLLTALAMLTKGPVALVLVGATLLPFSWLQRDGRRLWHRLQPMKGLALTLALTVPWYALALLREGEPYWRSFFGYHNLQRFTQVVNNHQQPWWYFFVVMLVASLPSTPLLILGLVQQVRQLPRSLAPEGSLGRFAFCWLGAVLVFFSCSATKLPSYWLPATPAVALLVALALPPAARRSVDRDQGRRWPAAVAMELMAAILVLVAATLICAPLWMRWIVEPSMPGLQPVFSQAPMFCLGALVAALAALLAAGLFSQEPSLRWLQSQLVWLLMVPLVALPSWSLGDQLRGAPVRAMAVVAQRQSPNLPLAMVGLIKPSLHYYSRRAVVFEGRSPSALVNLAERLRQDIRPGLEPSAPERQPFVLLVIDSETAARPHWLGARGRLLGAAGPYRLLLLQRGWLERRASELSDQGVRSSWRESRPERF